MYGEEPVQQILVEDSYSDVMYVPGGFRLSGVLLSVGGAVVSLCSQHWDEYNSMDPHSTWL